MKIQTRVLETVVILLALASVWPIILGYTWALTAHYKYGVLTCVLIAMVWVTLQRMARIRSAAEEAKRKRDMAERSGRPPWLGG